MRKVIQVAVMDGRPCVERVESMLSDIRRELRSCIDHELSLVATRALKPLFSFVAPGVLGLLFTGLWIVWRSSIEGTAGIF